MKTLGTRSRTSVAPSRIKHLFRTVFQAHQLLDHHSSRCGVRQRKTLLSWDAGEGEERHHVEVLLSLLLMKMSKQCPFRRNACCNNAILFSCSGQLNRYTKTRIISYLSRVRLSLLSRFLSLLTAFVGNDWLGSTSRGYLPHGEKESTGVRTRFRAKTVGAHILSLLTAW